MLATFEEAAFDPYPSVVTLRFGAGKPAIRANR